MTSIAEMAFYESPAGQIYTSVDGVILDVNRSFCCLVRRTREELQGKKFEDLQAKEHSPLSPGDGPKRIVLVQSNSECLSVVAQAVMVSTDIWLITIQDASEVVQLETELKRIAEELDQFAYIASHDLREPLIAVAGYASLLKRRCPNRHEGCNECLDRIGDSTKHMERKIDDLLSFSRAGRSSVVGTFSLMVALNEAKRALVRQIAENEARITILNGGLPVVKGNRSMIAQVFQNLISNALKYRKRSLIPQINIEAHLTEGMIEVRVEDNGIGFDMKYQDRVFDIFQRLHTIEQYPGTGMGLSIAKRIVERHGGSIWVRSKPRQGTTFFFTLPCVE